MRLPLFGHLLCVMSSNRYLLYPVEYVDKDGWLYGWSDRQCTCIAGILQCVSRSSFMSDFCRCQCWHSELLCILDAAQQCLDILLHQGAYPNANCALPKVLGHTSLWNERPVSRSHSMFDNAPFSCVGSSRHIWCRWHGNLIDLSLRRLSCITGRLLVTCASNYQTQFRARRALTHSIFRSTSRCNSDN